jgi:hypothetical protein
VNVNATSRLGAEFVCAYCKWRMHVRIGDRVRIAGYRHIVATVKSDAHGDVIVRAHAFQHNSKHRDEWEAARVVSRD